jgi:hypothetical protein
MAQSCCLWHANAPLTTWPSPTPNMVHLWIKILKKKKCDIYHTELHYTHPSRMVPSGP